MQAGRIGLKRGIRRKVKDVAAVVQASEVLEHDGYGTEPGSTESHLVYRFAATEFWLVLFVFAGVIKAVPLVAEAIPWDLTMIFGGLAAFFFTLRLLVVGRIERVRVLPADLWLIAFAFVLAAGSLYTVGPRTYALTKTANFVVLGVLASYAFLRLIAALNNPIAVVRNCFVAILAVAGILSLLAFVSAPGLGFLRTPGGSYLSWGYFVGGAIIAACTFLAVSRSKLQSVFLLMLTLFLVSALIYARGRGPLIALGGVLLVACVIYRWIPVRRRLLIFLGGIALLALLLIALPENLQTRYDRLLSDDVGASIESRLDAYGLAWRMFASSPLLGHGTGSYRAYHERFGYPHNIVLEAMAENGVIGLALLVGFIGSIWVRLARALRVLSGEERILIAGAGSIFLLMLIGSMFSGDLASRTLWFSAGLIVVATSRKTFCPRVGGRGQVRETQ